MAMTRRAGRTFSETAFEMFCESAGLVLSRIPEGTKKTPDYLLTLGRREIVVEIKQTEKNKEEEESDRVLAATGVGLVTGGTPGAKVRAMIAAASPQIKARTEGRRPSLLVLFDRGMVAGYCDPYHVRVGMYGLEQLVVALPLDRSERPVARGWKHGPKRKMTPDSNTSISAIGVLFVTGPDQPFRLAVYHNDFAAVPLKPDVLGGVPGITQYRCSDPEAGQRTEWAEMARPKRAGRALAWWIVCGVIVMLAGLLAARFLASG